ncbi:MAG: imidazoleglycerol-phosphate dehydratase HisB [Syntrophomonadaceae bacterium]|nr:imidazoleglycerol-phosphate dehydratase HisB [Syntrophomonadaceae bacterium]
MELSRPALIKRVTRETEITVQLLLAGTGVSTIKTGIGFFDHLLSLFARHGLFDLDVEARGDLEVDGHHTVEDVGLCLGQAIKDCLGERKGIRRYGHAIIPMDDALILVAVDLSGRPYLAWPAEVLLSSQVGSFATELVEEFLRAFVNQSGMNLHVRFLAGRNTHHMLEAVFKALGRALREATEIDPREAGVPSTKGILA